MSGRASKTQLALPTGIKKLTNIAVVRLKKAGTRFEIACYKNTVVAWRDGFEKDVGNVLQTTQVYGNVGKGVMAKEEDLLRAFGTKDEGLICGIILNNGELQVGEKERRHNFDNIFKDVIQVLCEKCVNPDTNRPYPPGMIESALKEIHFSVDPVRSAKQQALAAVPKLAEIFPIKRAAMRFKFVVGSESFASTIRWLLSGDVLDAVIENQTKNVTQSPQSSEITATADPSAYRVCEKFVKENGGRLEVLTQAVNEGGTTTEGFEGGQSRVDSSLGGRDEDNRFGGGSVVGDASIVSGGDKVFSTSAMAAALASADSSVDASLVSSQNGTRTPSRTVGAGTSRVERDVAQDAACGVEVLYSRGPIAGMPEEHQTRRARFSALDDIQPKTWQVELRKKTGSTMVDAVFFDAEGVGYKAFAEARREALRCSKK